MTGKGGWETQTHLHLPISLSSIRWTRAVDKRRRARLPDSEGDGRIPDHPRSGFAARNGQGRARSNPSALASIGILADAQSEEEINIQGTKRIASGPVQGTFKSGSTGNTAKGSATCSWTGFPTIGGATEGRAGMGGETLRRRSDEHLAGSDSI